MSSIYRMSDRLEEEVKNMGCGCNYGGSGVNTEKARSFLTREEKVELLKEYRNDLEKELKEFQKESKSSK